MIYCTLCCYNLGHAILVIILSKTEMKVENMQKRQKTKTRLLYNAIVVAYNIFVQALFATQLL